MRAVSNKPQDAESKQPDSSFIQLDDAKKKDAASAASAPRRKALFGALTAVCIVLIVVSLGFVQPSSSGAWSIDWIARAVAGKSVAGSGSTASRKTEAAGSSSSDAVDSESKDSDESDSKDKSESSDKKSDKDSKEKKSEGKGGKKSGDKSGSQNSGSTGGSSASDGSSSSAGSTTGGGSASNGGGASTGDQGGSQQPSHVVTVTVSVTSSAVGNPVSSGGTFTFNEGATPYDALCALGLSINARPSSYGTYVAAIGGLAEKEHGGTSGWMYSVNGKTPNTACSNYILKNGDTVVWYYVTG
ncbi:DUF4430 domain-containing protein [Collinsella sp. AF20-14LB]|nr:DUF4430 domain-containing protein [Collinsella sp. AF20-14LB]